MHLSVVPSISISNLPSCSGHELVWDGDAQPSLGRQRFKDGEGLHERLTDSTLVWEPVDTRVLDRHVASDRFDNALTGMVILWP